MSNNKNPIFEKSIKLHKKNIGKIGTSLKVPIDNKQDLSLSYTPGVAGVSLELYKDKNKAGLLSLKGNTIAVVSNGSAVLGLGDIGPFGAIPVMEGKAALFKRFANVDAFPICLDTKDPDEIVKTVKMIAPVFGGINLEDIKAPECFEIEKRLIKELDIPVMHDDQHGTAVVVLSALINAIKIVRKNTNIKIVINGAGAAGIAVTKLLLEYGFKDIIVCDSNGIINKSRKDLNSVKKELLKFTNRQNISGTVKDALLASDVFIGLSKGNLITNKDVTTMNKDAIVFAMANPIPEIMPEDAKKGGAKVVATGRSDFDNQINNVLAFPGIFKGALKNKVKKITSKMLIKAAIALSKMVKKPTSAKIIPSPFEKGIAETVARAIKN